MVSVALSSSYEDYVRKVVAEGRSRDFGDVVREALDLHRETYSNEDWTTELRAAAERGEEDIKAGRVKPYSPEFFDRIAERSIRRHENP